MIGFKIIYKLFILMHKLIFKLIFTNNLYVNKIMLIMKIFFILHELILSLCIKSLSREAS